ncbi:hypothetical protein HMPREF1222_00513 [Treponema vincentii F0403]|uniref:ABC transmembrane type-1 domain-containing protein n=1 Tax=Treponema vincentii F0403 TaxID=1125702 RepID=S3LDS8_9SPIR|nr:hypothetical protein [Treponema vincentii]EPF47611.1 hypothetical protein HMPREF1222_00513 [Treponema vincentii F0403]
MKKHSLSTILVLIILYTVLISTVLFVLYPVAFTVGAAFTKTNSLAATSISPIPKEPSVYQFKRLLTPADKKSSKAQPMCAAPTMLNGTAIPSKLRCSMFF